MNNSRRNKRCTWHIVWSLALGGLLLLSADLLAQAQESSWSEPIPISPQGSWSWFPDLAIDVYGNPHLVWCWTKPLERNDLEEQVLYSSRQGDTWQEPNDIVPPSADIERNAIATDQSGNIHLLFGGSAYETFTIRYKRAPADKAWSAAAWTEPHLINQGLGYMGDIAVDSQGVIHIIYDDTRYNLLPDQQVLADLYYRHSTDGGQTWSVPHLLYEAPLIGTARPYMEIDSHDVIHVTWDEGWDRLTDTNADEHYSLYTSSSDGGQTWAKPKLITYPDTEVVQLAVGSDGQGGVMLVWRSMKLNQIFYQWSADGGQTWQEPNALPDILARPWSNPFDMYDMATDSNGHIHLLIVGRQSLEEEAEQGVYHLLWDGEQWSAPALVFARPNLYPQYPKIVVHEGDQLHAAWFTWEGSVWEQDVVRTIWYSQRQIAAPHLPLTPWPTTTPEPDPASRPTATKPPTPTPQQFNLEGSGMPQGLYTDNDEWVQLAITLVPLILTVGALAAARMLWLKLRR
jgi:hypothetical protein